MIARRFVLDLVVPRTLADDDEALQAFGSMMWHEMLERAGGVPGPEPGIRTIIGTFPMANSDLDVVPIHIIGYAVPAIEVEFHLDTRPFETTIDELINGLVGAEMNLRVELPREFEGGMSGIFPVGGVHGIDNDGDDIDVWTNDEIPSVTDHQRASWRSETRTSPQGEHWGDAMRWTPDGGDKIL